MSTQEKSNLSPDAKPTPLPWHLLAFESKITTASGGNELHWARRACDTPHCNTTIVFLHGVLRNWRSFYPLFGPLSTMAHLVSLDFRGHGRSASTPGAYRVVDYVADALHVIDQLSGKLIIYGHSLGAMVALAACAKLPARIHSAILEDPPFATMGNRLPQTPLMQYFEGVSLCLSQLQADYPERPHFTPVVRDIELQGSEVAQYSMRSERYFTAFSNLVVGRDADGKAIRIRDQRDEPSRRFTAESLSQLDPRVLIPITTAQWLEQYDVEELARGIRSPVHLFQADLQHGGMLTDQDVRLLRLILGERLRPTYFAGVGHSMHWSQPSAICSILSTVIANE